MPDHHEIRIADHEIIPSQSLDEAYVTIAPPIPITRLAEIAIAALGQDSESIAIDADNTQGISWIGVAVQGEINARSLAIRLFADRVNLLVDHEASVGELTGDRPFSAEGWAAIQSHAASPSYTTANPYYGRTDLPDYAPLRSV